VSRAPSLAGLAGRARGAATWLAAARGRTALAWAIAAFLVLTALAGRPGISRDEARVLDAAGLATPGVPADSAARPLPPLSPAAAAVTHAVLAPLGLSHLRAARAATALMGAALSAGIALLAFDLAGPAAGALAPALFWAAPRHLHAGLVATPDAALAALALALVLAYRRALTDRDPRRRRWAALRAGLLFAAALAARSDAWVLLPALAVHALVDLTLPRPAPEAAARRHGAWSALATMAALGPLGVAAVWPALWSPARALAAFAPGARAPAWHHLVAASPLASGPARPLLVTALTVPAAVLLAWAGGLAWALRRSLRAAPAGGDPALEAERSDHVLLLLCAAIPFAAAAIGLPAAAPGVRPWLHAMPFLAIAGARALLAAARTAWPQRAAPLAASLALIVLWPGVRAAAHFYPSGSAAWNELAGGAPGAASLGLERQEPGEAAVRLLSPLVARAREGARVWWPTVEPAAVLALQRDGRLRPDLTAAVTPEDADVAVVTVDGPDRGAEYRVWSAFRTAAPVAGAYQDEVPLGFVYARPGAWR
jgi:hypothetical protein